MNRKTLRELDVQGKRILVRCDFNVPMDEYKNIRDDRRIRSCLPTIRYLMGKGGKIILLSHLGRPKGNPDSGLSLGPVAIRLGELLKEDVLFAKDKRVISENVRNRLANMKEGDIALLENTRFRKEEESNDESFAKELASLGDIYINDAFGTSHRAHASNVGLSNQLPSAVGFLVERELSAMGSVLENPKKPFITILGGAKVSDKIGVIENLFKKVDTIIIGGGMAFTFLKAKGLQVGKSILEQDKINFARELLVKGRDNNVNILLPLDVVVGKEFKNDTAFKTVNIRDIPEDMMGLDIGRETIELFRQEISKANTIIWNGPMGVFEMDNFKIGTEAVARAMAESKAITIVGGGDSALAVENAGYGPDMTHISTGGGASLEFLEGKILPGIGAIDYK